MNMTKGVRPRVAILAGALMALALTAVPFLGTAQDATPDASPVAADSELLAQGEAIYTSVCIACHQPDGKGIPGIYLPLAGNPLLTTEDPTYFIDVVLNGRGGMPRFDTTYEDEEIAAVISYIRQAWENDVGPITAEQVAEVRAQSEEAMAEDAPEDPVEMQATPGGQAPSDQADESNNEDEDSED